MGPNLLTSIFSSRAGEYTYPTMHSTEFEYKVVPAKTVPEYPGCLQLEK